MALLEDLESLWESLAGEEEVFRQWEGLFLRKSDDQYHLFHNSNHQAARWLEALGCEVSGIRMTNDFRVDESTALKESLHL